MRIKSDFKDYYDHVAHIYGVDDKIVYHRTRIRPFDTEYGFERPLIVDFDASFNPSPYRWDEFTGYSINTVIIGEKSFLIATTPDRYEYRIVDKHHPLFELNSIQRHLKHHLDNPQRNIKLARLVGHPVFTVVGDRGGRRSQVAIDSRCPILTHLGIASVYPADQIYQDLSHFLTNTMRDSPDEMPPSTLTDKEKILQHGLDPVKSFRHRK